MSARRPAARFGFVLPVGMVLFAACATFVLALMLLRTYTSHTTYRYQGVEWTDNECFIDDEGTLWCGWETT